MAVVAVPLISVAVSVATTAIKIYFETVRNRRESEYLQNLANAVDRIVVENEQRLKQAAFEAVAYELKDQIDSFREYRRQYKNDLTRLIDEAKVFQRKIGVQMTKLSNAIFRDHISLEAMRVWAESARFHIQLNYHMTNAGTQSSESLQSLVEIHRETVKKLCSEYRRSNPQSTYSETHDIEMIIEDATTWFSNPLSVSNDVNTSGAAGPANHVNTSGAAGPANHVNTSGAAGPANDVNTSGAAGPANQCASAESENLTKSENASKYSGCDDCAKCGAKPKRRRHNNRERKQREPIDAEKEHERNRAKDINNGLQRFYAENEHRMELDRARLTEEDRLQSKMADLKAEQKELTAQEKEEKLNDLTETFLCYRKMYCDNTGILTTETMEFQGKFMLQLTRLKNSVQTVDKVHAKALR